MKTILPYAIAVALLLAVGQAHAQPQKIDSLLKALPLNPGGEAHIDILNKLAFSYTLVSVTEAEKFVSEAVRLAQAQRYEKGSAEGYKILGTIFYLRGEHEKAIEYSYAALKIYDAQKDKSGQSKVLNNIALIFMARKDFARVYELTMRSLKLKREIGDSAGVATSTLALGEYYTNEENYGTALRFCKEALQRYQEMNDDWGTSHALLQIGNVYERQRNYPFASANYYDAIRYALMARDNAQMIAGYKQMGRLFLTLQQFDSSYTYLRKALLLARKAGSKSNEMDTQKIIADYFSATGNLDSALRYTNSANQLEHEIFDALKSQQIASLQMVYDFEHKEQELLYQRQQIRRQYVAIIGVSLILILSIIFGFKLFNLNKTNRLAKESLLKLNADINKINTNLETMVQERTEEIKQQNQKLIEYAFFTAHEVRGPLARILGLVELAKLKELHHDREEILMRLENAANELDDVIRTINRKLENNRKL